ncbi:MAG: helix-turn-helix domain-containing protein, partial [candidate division KSB1 bacterium]|nr:helix-turn-helix domain-containing protein [candidate division KSB1 bacterium]
MEQSIQYFNSEEAARILNVNVSSIKRWTEDGTLECIKTAGGHRKFTMQHLAKFLEQHKTKTTRANLFPIESEEDLEINTRILKADFPFLIDYVSDQSRQCHRDRVQRVFNGLYLAQHPLHEIYDYLVTPVLQRNGDLWEQGQITIVEEHFSTQTIRDCLIRLQGIIQIPAEKIGSAFCLIMSQELHDVAIKMVDHILELKGYQVLFSGQMTPSMKIEKIFDHYHPDRVYISSTIVTDLNLTQAEFDKICYIAQAHSARIFVGGKGFNQIDFSHPAVEKRLNNFEEVFL